MRDYKTYRPLMNRDRKVYVLDTDTKLSSQLSVLLRLEGYDVKTTSSVTYFENDIQSWTPAVAIINFDLDGADGLDLIRPVRELNRNARVVMLTKVPDVARTVSAIKRGAVDVHMCPFNEEKLLLSLREDLDQVQHTPRTVNVDGFRELTQREREILKVITQGLTNKQIAEDFGISARTVEAHRASVRGKLGVKNTAQLMSVVLGD